MLERHARKGIDAISMHLTQSLPQSQSLSNPRTGFVVRQSVIPAAKSVASAQEIILIKVLDSLLKQNAYIPPDS